MSWLKSAVSKVREKGEELKSAGAVPTLNALKEKTQQVVASAANQVKKAGEQVRQRSISSIEVEARLEQAARSTRSPPALAELHRSWVSQLMPKEPGSPACVVRTGDREMSFKEMLLQSRALEITLEVIASSTALRHVYVEPPVPEDSMAPTTCLHDLLCRTLDGDANQRAALIRNMLASEDLSDTHIRWFIGAVSAMKMDWQVGALYVERKELALRAEYLRQEIKQLGAAGSSTEDVDRHRRKVSLSTELLETYQSVKKNVEDEQVQRQEGAVSRESDLKLILDQIQAHMVTLQSDAQTSNEKQKHLEGELQQSSEGIHAQLRHMDDVRIGIDKEIEVLEERKRALRMELDECSRKLDETRLKQRQHMGNCDLERSTFSAKKLSLKHQMDSAEDDQKGAVFELEVSKRAQQLVRNTEGIIQTVLAKQMEERKEKQSKFDSQFQELFKEHLTFAEEQLEHLRSRASTVSTAEERVAVAKTAQDAHEAFGVFRETYSGALGASGEEERVTRLQSEHQKLFDSLGGVAAVSTSTTAEVVRPATPQSSPAVSSPKAANVEASPAPNVPNATVGSQGGKPASAPAATVATPVATATTDSSPARPSPQPIVSPTAAPERETVVLPTAVTVPASADVSPTAAGAAIVQQTVAPPAATSSQVPGPAVIASGGLQPVKAETFSSPEPRAAVSPTATASTSGATVQPGAIFAAPPRVNQPAEGTSEAPPSPVAAPTPQAAAPVAGSSVPQVPVEGSVPKAAAPTSPTSPSRPGLDGVDLLGGVSH